MKLLTSYMTGRRVPLTCLTVVVLAIGVTACGWLRAT
jgi:hypothetical protein